MRNKASELESRFADEGFLRLLFARPSGFACHTPRYAMRLRSPVFVSGRRFGAEVSYPGASRSCVRPFAATRGFRRSLRASEASLAMPPVGSRGSPSHLSGCVQPAAFPYHSAATTQCEETPNKGAAANCSARHGSCCSRSWPSRSVAALFYVRRLLLRSTPAATAPRSAVR